MVRNLLFLIVVLYHGFRRLSPPVLTLCSEMASEQAYEPKPDQSREFASLINVHSCPYNPQRYPTARSAMNETASDSTQAIPLVMRWKETVSDGVHHWYLAALRGDASFWGYVHIRTDSLSENRSFDGQLPQCDYHRIRSLVDSVDVADAMSDGPDTIDGLIGLGSRTDCATIIRYNPEPFTLPNAELFLEVVDILQPHVISAANLIGGDRRITNG
jgi:hypothetical protein